MSSSVAIVGVSEMPAWAGAKTLRLHTLASWGKLGEFHIAPGYVFPAEKFSSALEEVHQEIVGAGPFIVRSSASDEDREGESRAGLYRSAIITRFQDMKDAVDAMRGHAATLDSNHLALLVQPYIQMHCAGVAFSCAPGMPRGVALISAALGQCSGVTAGVSSTESHIVQLSDGKALKTHREQSRLAVLWDPSTGHERSCAAERDSGPVLGNEALRSLARLLLDLDQHLGQPVDIEWAVGTDGKFWLLQARPCPRADCCWVKDAITPRSMRRSEAESIGWHIPARWLMASGELPRFRSTVGKDGALYVAMRFGDSDGLPLDKACTLAERLEDSSGMWVVEQFLDLNAGGLCESLPNGTLIEYGSSTSVGALTRGWVSAKHLFVATPGGSVQGTVPADWPTGLPSRLAQLAHATRQTLGPGPIEWGLVGDDIYFLDMTTTFRIPHCDGRVIYPGYASGPVRRITVQCGERDVLIPSSHVYSPRQDMTTKASGEIIVAGRPSMDLLPWIGRASGFVFGEGSQLAHMCILLMENEVPSVINPEIANTVHEGDWVTIDGARVKRMGGAP
jgi:phosphohistidine swiveling domain-containing protein